MRSISITNFIYKILSQEQIQLFDEASEPQKKWLIEYIQSGDPIEAAKIAYPNCKKSGYRQMAYKNRTLFKISIADLYRNIGIDEVEIGRKIKKLLNGKKVMRIYEDGELKKEIQADDPSAIKAGIELSIRMLALDPYVKIANTDMESVNQPLTLSELIQAACQSAPNATIQGGIRF